MGNLGSLPYILFVRVMKYFFSILIILFVLSPSGGYASSPSFRTDSLLREVDREIERAPRYEQRHAAKLDSLHTRYRMLQTTTDTLRLFGALEDLIGAYAAFDSDSTLHYMHAYRDLAQAHDDLERATGARLKLCYYLCSIGMYVESYTLFQEVDLESLPPSLKIDYYDAGQHLFGELAFYAKDPHAIEIYEHLSRAYKDSIYQHLPPDADLVRTLRETDARDRGEYGEALRLNDLRLSRLKPDDREYPIALFYRFLIYQAQEDREAAMATLAKSAIADIRNATRDHASLWTLAEMLHEAGDIDRSYKYIRFSWNETNKFNARLRNLQSAHTLSIIDASHQKQLSEKNANLRGYVFAITTVTLLLVAALILIWKQYQRLSRYRLKLEGLNADLMDATEKKEQSLREQQALNIELEDANRIKMEYLTQFMQLASHYVNKMGAFRKDTRLLLKAGKRSELNGMLESKRMEEESMEEFFSRFDRAFLEVFPDFIDQLNALLREEERMYPKEGEILSPELRIYALMRLGITSSQQIADFLRYSVNTIYSYRSKMKGKALDRDSFEYRIRHLR